MSALASRAAALTVALLAFHAVMLAPAALAERPSGRQIMEWVDERDTGDNGVAHMQMTLIDKRGNERVREIVSYSKKKGEDDQTIMFFESPADVKDTGFLTYDFDDPDRDDDQWLYLPALKKVKRIASGDKSGSFMGSDFSYADMSSRPLDRYQYTLMQETDIAGVPVWQIESIPNAEEAEETGYTKSIAFIRMDNHVMVRAVNWVKKGNRLKYFEVKKLEQIDGIWVATEMTMTTKKDTTTLHRTILQQRDVRFGQDLSPDFFTVRQLEKGP
jgi:hypothetical protein